MTLAEPTTAANDERTGATPSATPAPAPFRYDPATMSVLPDGTVYAWDNKAKKMGDTVLHKFPSKADAFKSMTTSSTSPSDPPSEKRDLVVAEPIHPIPEKVDSLLLTILTWPRKHESVAEYKFCAFLREHIKAMGIEPSILANGCIVAEIKRPAPTGSPVKATTSTTLFSCHVDTIEGADVPYTTGEGDDVVVVRKKLNYDPTFGLIGLEDDSIGGSLGADDGAGVWLMLKMMERKVPGTYIFHRGEEVGCIGSQAMRDKYADLLKAYEAAIAFDRHDTFEVIRVQGGQTCASKKFTQALCERLNKQGMRYESSDRGVLTDVKHYRKLIPECVNIAVGYQDQHTRKETLDFAHLSALLEAVCNIDWDSLPIDRDPNEVESWGGYGGKHGYGSYGRTWQGHLGFDREDDYAFPGTPPAAGGKKGKKKDKKKQAPALTSGPDRNLTVSDELSSCTLEELETWAFDSPDDAAKALGQLLVEIRALKASNEALMDLLGFDPL